MQRFKVSLRDGCSSCCCCWIVFLWISCIATKWSEWESPGKSFFQPIFCTSVIFAKWTTCLFVYSPGIKTHHYIIFFVRPLHSEMESYCWSSTDQLSWYAIHGAIHGAILGQVWSSCWLWGVIIMAGCVLSQLKSSELYILSCGKGRGQRRWPFYQLRM